jgi:hypothetical protein
MMLFFTRNDLLEVVELPRLDAVEIALSELRSGVESLGKTGEPLLSGTCSNGGEGDAEAG